MSIEVDIEKSKSRRRLCLREPLWVKFMEIIVLYLFGSIPLFVCLMVLLNNDSSLSSAESILIAPVILLSIFMLYRITIMNQLRTIVGKGEKVNRKLTNELIRQIGLIKTLDRKDHIIAETPVELTSWGHVAVFIFHKGDILVNVYTKGIGGTKSPFHIISQSNLWWDIKSKFK